MTARRVALAAAAISLSVACAIWSSPSRATTYDLTTDFSSTSNPNGVWSFMLSGNALAHQSQADAIANSGGNPALPAIPAGGYFSTGPNLNVNTPDVIQAAVNGSSAGETDGDFLSGDVIVHSPNSGALVSIVWTAPTSGTITDLLASVWYAHSVVNRSNDVTLDLGASLLTSWTVSRTSNFNRSNPGTFGPDGPLSVSAGETLTLNLQKTAGQDFGSLDGVQESLTFTAATPLPATWTMLIAGFVGLGFLANRGSKKNAVATATA